MVNMAGYDASQHDPVGDFTPIPEGWYRVMAVESEEKETANRNGTYIQLRYEVIEGEFKGRSQWSRHNVNNPSDQAMRIAQSEISSICRAVGVMRPNDTVDLHNIPLFIHVKQELRKDNGELTNRTVNWRHPEQMSNDSGAWLPVRQKPGPRLGGAQTPQGGQAAPSAPPAAPAAPKTPPWRR